MNSKFVFVGENRSPTAIKNGWTWRDGRLAAKPLFEALDRMGLDPDDHHFVNVFRDQLKVGPLRINRSVITGLRTTRSTVVALGRKVSKALTDHGIAHTMITHPAARGRIRKRSRYIKHVNNVLSKVVANV